MTSTTGSRAKASSAATTMRAVTGPLSAMFTRARMPMIVTTATRTDRGSRSTTRTGSRRPGVA